MPNEPLVSVLLPAYNSEKTLDIAIESILKQTFKEFELIIIDDGSSDKTGEIANKHALLDNRIKLVTNGNNIKLIATLNKGLSLCKGQYIARMDADDYSVPERLEKQYNYMQENPEVGVLGAGMYVCDEMLNPKSIRSYPLTDKEIRKHIFRFNPFCHPVVFFRKSVIDQIEGYQNNLKHVEDYDLYFRAGMISKFANLPDILLKYRTTKTSITNATTRLMEINTIKTRLKYLGNYKVSIVDVIYNCLEFFTLLIIPSNLRVKLFQFFRDVKYKPN